MKSFFRGMTFIIAFFATVAFADFVPHSRVPLHHKYSDRLVPYVKNNLISNPGGEEFVMELYTLSAPNGEIVAPVTNFIKNQCWGECDRVHESSWRAELEPYKVSLNDTKLSKLKVPKFEQILKTTLKEMWKKDEIRVVSLDYVDGSSAVESVAYFVHPNEGYVDVLKISWIEHN